MTEKQELSTYPVPCDTCDKTNYSAERCYFGINAANRPPSRSRRREWQNQAWQRDNQIGTNDSTQAAAQTLN